MTGSQIGSSSSRKRINYQKDDKKRSFISRFYCTGMNKKIHGTRKLLQKLLQKHFRFALDFHKNRKCKNCNWTGSTEQEPKLNNTIDASGNTDYSAGSVKSLHLDGFEHDKKMNIYIKNEDDVDSTVDKVSPIENEPVVIDVNIIDKSEEKPAATLSEFSVSSNLSSQIGMNDEKCKNSQTVMLIKSYHKSPIIHKDSYFLEVVRQFGNAVNEINFKEVTHLENDAENQRKPFEMEKPDKNEKQLMEEMLLHKNFKIRTEILVYMVPNAKLHPAAIEDIPWTWLNEEKWRLHTYSRYPHNANKSAILLAEAGFAYLGSGKGGDDRLICYFCCVIKQHWQVSDIISDVHRDVSPNCPMVTGIDCNNVPMIAPESGIHLFGQLSNSRGIVTYEVKRQHSGHEIAQDNIEVDSAHGSGHLSVSGQIIKAQGTAPRKHNLPVPSSGNNNVVSEHGAKPIQMANQTVMRPNGSRSPTSGQSTVTTSRPTAPSRSDVSAGIVTSNSNSISSSNLNVASPDISDATGTQESQNNRSARANPSTAAATVTAVQTSAQNVQQPEQTAVPSSPTASSQVNQEVSSNAQNTSTASTATTTTSSSTAIRPTATTPITTMVNHTSSIVHGLVNPSVTETADTQNSNRVAGRTPTYNELGIITERPKRFEYAVRAKRFESFEPWPRDHHLKKEDLADAGFYYAGYGDCARCFYCGGGLRNWEDNDNVWVEHARWFPKCAFIRQTMGQQFVDAVQDLNRDKDQISFEMVSEKMGSSAASFQMDTKTMPLKRDPAVVTVLAMGYKEEDVIVAATFVKDSCGMLSADKLFEKLELDGKRREKKDNPADSQAVSITTDMTKDKIVMNQLKEQNSQLRQQTVCKICMDKEVAVVFLPCGHLVSCTDCAAALKDCPVCRNSVRGIVRAFMA